MEETVNKTYFALLDDTVIIIEDEYNQKDWLYEEYRVTKEDFEELICGYIMPNRVVIYKSSDYLSMSEETIRAVVDKIADTIIAKEGIGEYVVWNGMVKDSMDDTWKPRDIGGELYLGADHSVSLL